MEALTALNEIGYTSASGNIFEGTPVSSIMTKHRKATENYSPDFYKHLRQFYDQAFFPWFTLTMRLGGLL